MLSWGLLTDLAVVKPTGLYLSAPDAQAILHPQARGCLIRVRWSEIEPVKGVYSFASVHRQLDRVAAAKKDWSLGIVAGQHAPTWLIEDSSITKITYDFRGTIPIKIPVGWNPDVQMALKNLAQAAAKEFGSDPQLKLVYVPQMSANGIEGHFNGCPDEVLTQAGFTEDRWVNAVEQTAIDFATAFSGKALAVEVHDIRRRANAATRIMNDLWANKKLEHRVGAALWWLSGRSSYQEDLLGAIKKFPGDKYAQVIARSSDSNQFQGGSFTSIFQQAKDLGIRYIEPWESEFKGSTYDSAMKDFNEWADSTFGHTQSVRSNRQASR